MWKSIHILMLLIILACIFYKSESSCPNECKCNYVRQTAQCKSLPEHPFDKIMRVFVLNGENQTEKAIKAGTFEKLNLAEVVVVKIENIKLRSIDSQAFKKLARLETVSMENIQLDIIPSDVFSENTYLEKIILSGNTFTNVGPHFLNNSNVKELILSNCKINHLDKTAFNLMSSLSYIDLKNNFITNIDSETFDRIIEIEELNLENNFLTKLHPKLFAKLDDTLDVLILNGNPLSTLAGLPNSTVSHLEACNCNLESLSQNMFRGTNKIMNLILSSNKITKIHANTFEHLADLQRLDLSNNQLSSIPAEIFYNNNVLNHVNFAENSNLKQLPENGFISSNGVLEIEFINVSYCGLEKIDHLTFSGMAEITLLYLQNNKITHIHPGAFEHLIRVVQMDLSNNLIMELHENLFKKNILLNTLKLSGNPIKIFSIVPLVSNPNLVQLDISHCQLVNLWEVPKEPGHYLKNIKYLNVSFNEITTIKTDQLEILPSLQVLEIMHNPLECTKDLANMITWLGSHSVSPTQNPTHVPFSESLLPEKVLLPYRERWEELAKNRCHQVPPAESTHSEIMDETIWVDDQPNSKKDPIDNIYYEDEDIENENDLDYKDIDKNVSDNEVQAMPITFGSYVSVWTATMVTITMLSLISILTALNLIKRRRQDNSPYIRSVVHTNLGKKDCGLVYRPLSEDVTEPPTPVLARLLDSQICTNDVYHSRVRPENV